MWMLLWLAFCLLEHSHSLVFPFPMPFFAPSYTNQQDGEKNLQNFSESCSAMHVC